MQTSSEAAWPSGLRRQLQALVRKGASSNLAAVSFSAEVGFFVLSLVLPFLETQRRSYVYIIARSCGPMDKASVYGTGDCRFESYQDHFSSKAHIICSSWLKSHGTLAMVASKQ